MPETTIGVSRLLTSGANGASAPVNLAPGAKLVEEIVKRQKRLEAARRSQDDVWDDTDMNITSRRSHYNVGYIRGDSSNDQGGSNIFDDAAAAFGLTK